MAVKSVLMGIGNELKGDDGIGNAVAREFQGKGWKPVECETVPENFIAIVKRERPELLVIVDAASMGLAPGQFR
ncbi:MAG: hydrogenase maturation protease, partial [Candidatus Diapherotrites archaeon]|nr:hydrogenase maturation protease [Candidatus Diapherotrites archaeon]